MSGTATRQGGMRMAGAGTGFVPRARAPRRLAPWMRLVRREGPMPRVPHWRPVLLRWARRRAPAQEARPAASPSRPAASWHWHLHLALQLPGAVSVMWPAAHIAVRPAWRAESGFPLAPEAVPHDAGAAVALHAPGTPHDNRMAARASRLHGLGPRRAQSGQDAGMPVRQMAQTAHAAVPMRAAERFTPTVRPPVRGTLLPMFRSPLPILSRAAAPPRSPVTAARHASVAAPGPVQVQGRLSERLGGTLRTTRCTPGAAAAQRDPVLRDAAALVLRRPLDLAWRPAQPAAHVAPVADAPPPTVMATPRQHAEAAPPAARHAAAPPPAAMLDPGLAERLVDDVIRRIDRRARVARERRGL